MKRPAFQFYPADWRKDSALQSCGIAARGLWHEMMCIMHECVPYGHLAVNGAGMSTSQLARLVGESERAVRGWLTELDRAGVYSKTADGIIYSRRMVNDERLRNVRAEAGKLGGNPALLDGKDKQKDKQPDNHPPNQPANQGGNQSPTPSSSSSASGGIEPSVEKETPLPAQIAIALRSMGVKNASFTNPDVIAWADAGVTVEQAREAARIAIEDRNVTHPATGYLTPILNDMRTPPKARAAISPGAGKPWFLSWEQIVAKGAEKGLTEDAFDSSPAFRAAVFSAHGITNEDVRKAEADWKVAA